MHWYSQLELYIIRHGQSTNNILLDERVRVSDPALTPLGEQQAALLADHLANGTEPALYYLAEQATGLVLDNHTRRYGLNRLYCSPMLRSLQTAQPVGEALGLTPEVWIDVHEQGGMYLDYGEPRGIEGQPGISRGDLLARFPNYVVPDDLTEAGWWTRGFEEWSETFPRALRVAERVRGWAAGVSGPEDALRVGIVSHGGFADALLKTLLHGVHGEPNGTSGIFYAHGNTAITRVDFGNDNRLHVAYINRLAHLPPEFVS